MSSLYETRRLLSEYLLFHYGSEEEILPSSRSWPAGMREALGFPLRTVSHFSATPVARGLDLGCAVGRSSFEMARHCDEVIGVDLSRAFIDAAQRIGAGEAVAYERTDEGSQATALVAELPADLDGARVNFVQGDVTVLPESLGRFDRVHAANLLCRLPEPVRLLERLPELLVPGGELVLATPCTWLEEFTPLPNWPTSDTLDWLRDHLGRSFELVDLTEEPFLIRETARKFQWSSSMVTRWKRI